MTIQPQIIIFDGIFPNLISKILFFKSKFDFTKKLNFNIIIELILIGFLLNSSIFFLLHEF